GIGAAHRVCQQLAQTMIQQQVVTLVNHGIVDHKTSKPLGFGVAQLSTLNTFIETFQRPMDHAYLVHTTFTQLIHKTLTSLQQQSQAKADDRYKTYRDYQPDTRADCEITEHPDLP